MKCKQCFQEISNYFDGDIDEALKQELMVHLKDCHKCQVVFDTTRTTIELYCDGKIFPLPDDVRNRLHRALERRRHSGTAS
jgi:anti-sigma factor RsiW